MTSEADGQLCEWNAPGCFKAATRHVSWIIRTDQSGDGWQDRHFGDAHTAEMHERPGDARDWAILACGPSCPIIFDLHNR